MVDKMSEPLPE